MTLRCLSSLLILALMASVALMAQAQAIAPTPLPLGLAYAAPSPTNPLASVVAINTAAPLQSVASSAPAAGAGSPVLQVLNQEANALKHAIAVQIIVSGVESVDALAVGEVPHPGQGHFHWRLDAETVVATAAPRIDWHQVASGAHQVACWTVDNAHQPTSDAIIANVHIA